MKLAFVGLFALAASNIAPGCSPAELLEWWRDHGGDHHPSRRCEALPSDFYVEGCGFRTVCHTTQTGCDWQAVCNRGEVVLSGTGALSAIGFTTAAGYTCAATVDEGQVHGSCALPIPDGGVSEGGATGGDAAGAPNGGASPATCEFATREPMPTPSCIEVPNKLNFAGCGVDEGCTVAQHGCEWLASCGDQVFGGTASDTGVSWTNANSYRCSATLENGALAGTCQPPAAPGDAGTTSDSGAGAEACTLTAVPPLGTPPAPICNELPSSFVLDGCGQEVPCQIDQRGCIWQASCGSMIFGGRGRGREFSWVDEEARKCISLSVNGSFAGSCRGDDVRRCGFRGRDAVPSPDCINVPADVTVQGCGWDTPCAVIQDGCTWQASCNNGDISFGGSADALSLSWNVGGRYPCTGAPAATGGITGTCQNGSQQCDVTITPAASP